MAGRSRVAHHEVLGRSSFPTTRVVGYFRAVPLEAAPMLLRKIVHAWRSFFAGTSGSNVQPVSDLYSGKTIN
jgi:hypothetical protein